MMKDKKKQGLTDRLTQIRNRRVDKPVFPQEPVRLQVRKSNVQSGENEKFLEAQRKRNQKVSLRWVSAIISLALSAMLTGFVFLPEFRIQAPNVSRTTMFNLEEINYYSGLNDLPVFMVDPETVRDVLMRRYPELRDVEVTLKLPAEVDVQLETRVPVVEWDFGGSKFWIDEDGLVLNETSLNNNAIYVLANSFPGAKSSDDRDIPLSFTVNTLNTILHVNQYLPEGKTLFYTYDNGFGWDTDDGWRLFVGVNDNAIDEKIAMSQSLKKYLNEEEIVPDMLSVEFTKAPYYRFAE